MASVSCVLSEDQFRCPICLDVFTDPVSTPCGHSFCKGCLEQQWTLRLQCPVCDQSFRNRPQMMTNTVVAEMVSRLKSHPPVPGQAAAVKHPTTALGEGDVPCDLCPEPRLKALKSCLLCLASYCHDHLQPHVTNPRLKRHQLIEADQDLDERICPEHDAPLEMFSRSESKLICLQCFSDQRKAHDAVPLKVQRDANEARLKEMIQKRRAKIEEVQSLVQLSQNKADQEIQDGVKVFDALMECVRRSQETFKKNIEEKHRNTEKTAAELIEKIRKEILELLQKASELEEASDSEDHLQVLQKFSSLTHKEDDWSAVIVRTDYSTVLVQAVDQLQNKQFADECRKVFKVTLSRLKRFEAEVTFDPATAQSCLQVSEDKKEVRHTDTSSKQRFSLFHDRFQSVPYVMGQQKISSGQLYFEVTVRNKIMWAVGVANESVRTQMFQSYDTSQMWLMTWDNEETCPAKVDGFSVAVRATPQNIGVFVDHDRRRISFYDADTADFIHSAENCGFSRHIRPIFSPGESMTGKNCEPLKLHPLDFGGFSFKL